MNRRSPGGRTAVFVAAAMICVCAHAHAAEGQESSAPPAEDRAQGERTRAPEGSAWTTKVAPSEKQAGDSAASTPAENFLSVDQIELIQRVNAYFNAIEHLQGRFRQIGPNGEKTRGKFYVRRPGRLRFDYAPPSRLRIVADGEYLSIEDHDLNTVDQYPLDSTPFGLLLAREVNLLRDAVIVDLSRSEEVASLTVEDKGNGSRGRLQLFFTLPDIKLKEWIITDAQGLDTRIQLADMVRGERKKKEFFKSTALDIKNIQD